MQHKNRKHKPSLGQSVSIDLHGRLIQRETLEGGSQGLTFSRTSCPFLVLMQVHIRRMENMSHALSYASSSRRK